MAQESKVEKPVENRDDLIPTLRTMVKHLEEVCKDPRDPILICGDWGSGKSSVLKVLEAQFKKSGRPTIFLRHGIMKVHPTFFPFS